MQFVLFSLCSRHARGRRKVTIDVRKVITDVDVFIHACDQGSMSEKQYIYIYICMYVYVYMHMYICICIYAKKV
jgi:hypothetical protein